MNAFRLTILLILFSVIVFILWRLQKNRTIKLITRWFLIPFVIIFLVIAVISSRIINKAAANKIYSDVNLVPYRETALVLGANKNTAAEFFNNRINAAFLLYKSGKVKNFIVSGCDGPANYDEAADMKSALVAKGVPDSLIVMDKEGDNTLASIVRSKEIYKKSRITVVSQSYHTMRAVYIASKNEVDAIGFYTGSIGVITPPKEYLSKIKAVFFR